MADYRLRDGGGVLYLGRIAIPPDPLNREWRKYQGWLAAGNTADPALPPPTRPTTPEETALAAVAAARTIDDLKAALSAYFAAQG